MAVHHKIPCNFSICVKFFIIKYGGKTMRYHLASRRLTKIRKLDKYVGTWEPSHCGQECVQGQPF